MSLLETDSLSVQELESLLDEAIATANEWEGELGEPGTSPAADAFRALKEGKLSLGSPEATLRVLRSQDLEGAGIPVKPAIREELLDPKGWDYVLVNLPVLLFPGRGSEYRLVEAALNAGSTRAAGRQPAVHAIFPEALWQPVLELGGRMELALDGGLSWGAQVERVKVDLGKLGGELAGRVGTADTLASHIRILPFQYQLGRAKIEAKFAGPLAMWRIDAEDVIRASGNVQFVAIVKVPKEVDEIEIAGAVQAQVSFQWLTGEVGYIFEHLSLVLQGLISERKGPALRDEQIWRLSLPRK